MKAKIIKIGNSKGIRLPNELIKEYKLDEEVTLELREDCIVIKPVEVEFWQGRANRLHDRIRYKLEADFSWKIERLSP